MSVLANYQPRWPWNNRSLYCYRFKFKVVGQDYYKLS